MGKVRTLSPQEALNLVSDASRKWGANPNYSEDPTYQSEGGNNGAASYGKRFYWRHPEANAYAVGGNWTFDSGSTTITQGTAPSSLPVEGQYVKGTNIPSDTRVVSRLSGSKFTIDKATTGANNTDGKYYDPNPHDDAATFHVDVSNSSWVMARFATMMQISFSSSEQDIKKIREGDASDKKHWSDVAAGSSQEGDLPIIAGVYRFLVPRGLGDKVYFNFKPFLPWHSTAYYCYILTEEGPVV